MKKTYATLLTVLAVAGIAAASALTVNQKTDTVNIFAERFALQDRYEIADTAIGVAPSSLAAIGVQGAAVEITSLLPPARTAIQRDHWTYAATVRENGPASSNAGTLTLRLLVDNAPVGTVFVEQKSLEDAAIEGARAVFDIGPTLSSNALYFLEIRPFVPTGPAIVYQLESASSGTVYSWKGKGGGIDGQTNATLDVPLGATVTLVAINGDGASHNIGIKTGALLLDPPGWSDDIDTVGEQVAIAWKPTSTGTYSYQCKYHPSMKGALVVTDA